MRSLATARSQRGEGVRTSLAGVCLLALVSTGGCASTSIHRTGALSSYDGMLPVHVMGTKALMRVDAPRLMAAKTLRIEPVAVRRDSGPVMSEAQRRLIANALERSICARLSARFDVVGPHAPADLDLRVAITGFSPTNGDVAAASVAATVLAPVPITPRIPLGLGSLSVEAEAVDPNGRQVAAMVWTRGADAFTSRARLSRIGDAYDLSGEFAQDMAILLITGRNPLRRVPIPEWASLARTPSPACAAYGKGGGMAGFIESMAGAPPEWTDGRRPPQPNR